jgi:hypothetical protein
MDKPPFNISSETGKQILKWCNEGISPAEEKRRITERINASKSINELIDLYNLNPDYQQDLLDEFVNKRVQLQALIKTPVNQISDTLQTS